MWAADEQPRAELADALRDLRRASGLSGERLGKRCLLSQTKISRIETGRVLPTVDEVERILAALGVPAEPADEIIALARRANVEYQSFRAYAQKGLWRMQEELKVLEGSCSVMRHFLPAIPSGLLQTERYVREVFRRKVASQVATDVDKAVAARLRRQETLRNEDRRFHFVLTEQAVRWRYGSAEVMAEQCRHVASLAQASNVDIAVIPHANQVSAAPLHVFTLYDERLVELEMMSGWVSLRDPVEIRFYREMFDLFWSSALTGTDAVVFLESVAEDFMRMPD